MNLAAIGLGNAPYQLIDRFGRVVYVGVLPNTAGASTTTVPLAGLASGVYAVRIQGLAKSLKLVVE